MINHLKKSLIRLTPKQLFAVCIILIFCAVAGAQTPSFSIKYLSAENVYVDAGKADGIRVGDSLLVKRGNESIAALCVTYTAEHSAACQVMTQQSELQVGDTVKPIRLHEEAELNTAAESRTRTQPRPRTRSAQKASDQLKIRGSASANWYHFSDVSTSRYTFNQPGFRLNLRLADVLAKNYNFQLVTRGRYSMRTTRVSSRMPEKEWRNRIYRVSFSYEDESAMINYKIGRIISSTFSGVGYIDGLQLQQNVSENFRYGVFAGTQPQWQYSTVQTALQKYGAYVNFSSGDFNSGRYEGTVAVAGEYHGATVSREFLYVQNNYNTSRFNIYQSADVDLNRDWRKERAGETVSMTNLYVYSNYQLTSDFSLGLSYDNRKNYYTYEIRSLADSLFDDAMRQGFRGNIRLKLPGRIHLFGNVGLRTVDSDQKNALSYALGINKYDLTPLRLFAGLYASSFSNHYSDGYHGSLRLGKTFRAGHDAELAFGAYAYNLRATTGSRRNQWLRFNFSLQLPASLYLTEQYEYTWGNDAEGHRFYTELGYRF